MGGGTTLLLVPRWVPRVYADTSVYGGTCDPGFESPSRAFFEQVRQAEFALVISAVVLRETERAPEAVKALVAEMLDYADPADVTDKTRNLQQAYLEAGIVTPRSADDALHVALATVSGCSMIVSWNFRHIAQFAKMRLYTAVNALHGCDSIAIHSPPEVMTYDED